MPSNNLCFIIYKRHGEVLDLHPFFLLLMESIETRARSYGYNILLCNLDKRKSMEPQLAHLEELDCQAPSSLPRKWKMKTWNSFRSFQFLWLPWTMTSPAFPATVFPSTIRWDISSRGIPGADGTPADWLFKKPDPH